VEFEHFPCVDSISQVPSRPLGDTPPDHVHVGGHDIECLVRVSDIEQMKREKLGLWVIFVALAALIGWLTFAFCDVRYTAVLLLPGT
jgi:hypothetical protein